MGLVVDTNFTNNLVSVAGFAPFSTFPGEKVLQLNISGGGVILGNDPQVANISEIDTTCQALIDAVAGTGNGGFGHILNREAGGKFYYLEMRPTGSGSASFNIRRYSGGTGGSFTTLASTGTLTNIYTVSTIFDLTARVDSSIRGPNLALLVDGQVVVSTIDDDAVNQINSGQPGLAGNIIAGDGTTLGRYLENWFGRDKD